jgi:hypothetical protein
MELNSRSIGSWRTFKDSNKTHWADKAGLALVVVELLLAPFVLGIWAAGGLLN